MKTRNIVLGACFGLLSSMGYADSDKSEELKILEVAASGAVERSAVHNLGFAIDEVRSDRVYIIGKHSDLETLKNAGFEAKANELPVHFRDFTASDIGGGYHSYEGVVRDLESLEANFPNLVSLKDLGTSFENRNIPMLRISSKTEVQAETEQLPVVFYMGCHHAREHLSVEIPLLFAQYMADQYGKNPDITRLLDSRELYIAPMINPDGHIHDFRPGQSRGRMWRKNRRTNHDGSFGVDLNRNYGYLWGTGGSSSNPRSDIYMGETPFSEPETVAIRDFVNSQPRMSVLTSFHTFSELILYPWGHSHDSIGEGGGNAEDLPIFEKMAEDMATWNNYTPQQSSDLYITSGDTTDWAYGEHGIFAFTFELSPRSMFEGGFYPGQGAIQPTFEENLRPMLYMLEYADDPSRVLTEEIPNFENTPAKSGIGIASFSDLHL